MEISSFSESTLRKISQSTAYSMIIDEHVLFQTNGHIDYEHERSIIQKMLASKGYSLIKLSDNARESFYKLSKNGKNNIIEIHSCINLNEKHPYKFWYGVNEKNLRLYPSFGLILTLVWRNRERIYCCIDNELFRALKSDFYLAKEYYSIDILYDRGQIIFQGYSCRVDISETQNKFKSLLSYKFI